MKKVVKVSFNTLNEGELQENGGWKVVSILTETNEYEDGTSRTEKIEAMCFDNNFVTAQQVALASALVQYREEVIDGGFLSLVQAREKEEENDNPQINADTPTQ
jgi:hypothetical protein